MRILSCGSPYGQGGIGQHFAQLVEETRAEGMLKHYYAIDLKPGDEPIATRVSLQWFKWIYKYTPLRFSPSWTSFVRSECYGRQVAGVLDRKAERFMGFVGESLHAFRKARANGCQELELVLANSHVNNLQRLHELAYQQTSIRDTWLNEVHRRKTIKEYEAADTIYVHSEYVRQSMVDEGIPAAKLKRSYLEPHARFEPPEQRPRDGVFRVAYVGRIDATKGVPLLIKAFSQLSVPAAELTLVGNWATRRMRRYMEQQLAQNARISVAPGDPLPVLQRADVLVHPTYEDGFGYAPMEALACGVPVIVTEDTGMKEYVEEGINGYVVPTGSWEALLERMKHVQRLPLAKTKSDDLAPLV